MLLKVLPKRSRINEFLSTSGIYGNMISPEEKYLK